MKPWSVASFDIRPVGTSRPDPWRTCLALFGLLILLVPSMAHAVSTKSALIRVSSGQVYEIRFPFSRTTGDLDSNYFVSNFSIHDRTGNLQVCPSSSIRIELYTAARILSNTPLTAQRYDKSKLDNLLREDLRALGHATRIDITANAIVDLVADPHLKKTMGINLPISVEIIDIPSKFIATLGKMEIDVRRLLWAYWTAYQYADAANTLQTAADRELRKLWQIIDSGQIVSFAPGGNTLDVDSGSISGEVGYNTPLMLRLQAEVYREYVEEAARLGTKIQEQPSLWKSIIGAIPLVGSPLGLLFEAADALQAKSAMERLERSLSREVRLSVATNIEDWFRYRGRSDLGVFCVPGLRFNGRFESSNIWDSRRLDEGGRISYKLALNSAPQGEVTVGVQRESGIAGWHTSLAPSTHVTASPSLLTFTPANWATEREITLVAARDDNDTDEIAFFPAHGGRLRGCRTDRRWQAGS